MTAQAQERSRNLKPEFTARISAGFVTEGPAVTAGIRVNDKRTLGIWIGKGDTYIDSAPANIHAVQTAAYTRRYVRLGSRDIVALYGEFLAGCGWIYRVDGNYQSGSDVVLYAGINTGIRLRIFRNVHLFLGPTLTTNTIGLHAGIGL